MKLFCINIYDKYRLHSQAHRALKCVYERVIPKCKNNTLQDYSRMLVILTTLSTFSVRLPFSTIYACFQKEVNNFCRLFDHKLYVQCCMLRSNTIYNSVIQYKIQEISTKRQKPIQIIAGCMAMLKTQLIN